MPIKWTKAGSFPQVMTDQRKVYRDSNGWSYTGVVGDDPRFSELFGYVQAPPEPTYDPLTERLGWDGSNWVVEELPPPPEQPAGPLQVTKIDFSRLFTPEQRGALEVLEYRANAADLTLPENAQYIAVKAMFRSFALPAEFIELDHPDTIQAFNDILIPQGVVTQAEAERILSNTPPPPEEPPIEE